VPLSCSKLKISLLVSTALLSFTAQAADFTIVNGQTVMPQSLNANESGIVEVGGAIDGATRAIDANGDNIVIKNSGTITVGGDNGINSVGDDVTINSSGTITVGGDVGIYAADANATISNSGAITVDGYVGINSAGANATINNSGTIDVGNDLGVYSYGANATISNSGTITAANNAIYSAGADATINNSGTIRATDVGGLAVRGDNNNVTLNLLAGSQIIGGIDLGDNGGDNDTVNIYSGSASAVLDIQNVENINLIGVAGFVDGNTVVTADPTAEAASSVVLADVTSSVHNIVNQRTFIKSSFKPVQVASLTLSPGMLFQEKKPVAWAQVFGGNADSDSQGSTLAYDSSHIGFTLGYEWDRNQTRLGVIGGVAHSSAESSDIASFKTESDSYYLGGYGIFTFDGFNVSTSVLAGYADNDNRRLVFDSVTGFETAEADFDSVFLSPSVTLSSAYTLADNLEFRPSASINYNMAWVDGYREKGTTNSNFKVDDRTLRVLTARAQLAAAYQFTSYSELEFRVGLSSRHSNDDDTDVSLAGNSFSYSNAGDENVDGRFAGVNLRIADQNNLTLAVDIEFGGNSDEDYVNGQISLAYSF